MRPLGAALALLAAAAGLTGCGALDAFPTFPKAAKPGPAAALPRVALCYNGFESSRADVTAEAQQQCPKGSLATPVATDYWLQFCPLLLPARITFACVTTAKK